MRGMTRGWVAAPALFLTAGLLVVSAGGADAQPEKEKGKGKLKGKDKDKGVGKAGKDLRKAYDGITDLTQLPPPGAEAGRLLDHAKAFYRVAVRGAADDTRRSAELAVAANDAVRGLGHVRRAGFRPIEGLPEPPTEFAPPPPPVGPKENGKGKAPPTDDRAASGPWGEARDVLERARDRIEWVGGSGSTRGPARDFVTAAREAYGQARTAYEAGEYRKAAELAKAAEAWTHVPEHLDRAGWAEPSAPPPAPEPKRKGFGAPPPPPPLKD